MSNSRSPQTSDRRFDTQHLPSSRLLRALRICLMLQGGGIYNSQELAKELCVSRRTIFRDLKALRDVGFPIEFDESASGYRLATAQSTQTATLDENELSILALATHFSPLCQVPGTGQFLREVLSKVIGMLPIAHRESLWRLMSGTSNDSSREELAPRHGEILSVIFNAIAQQQKIRILVKGNPEQGDIQTKVSPYHLACSDNQWLITGRSTLHRSVCHFRVDEISEIKLLSESYTVPALFRRRLLNTEFKSAADVQQPGETKMGRAS